MNGRIFIFLAVFFFISVHFYYYPEAPATMASHYGISGEADGWMGKDGFLIFNGALLFFLVGLFWGIAAFLPKMPNDLINMPNKDYWLDPSRREASLRLLQGDILITGALTILFVGLLSSILYRTALSGSQQLDPGLFWPLFIGYIVIMIGYVIRMQLRYKEQP